MSLKSVLASKAEVDALPEAVRGFYKEGSDGKFVLDVEGGTAPAEITDLKSKLAEFRDNNRTMYAELERLRPIAQKYEGMDPDKYKELNAEVEALRAKGVTKPDDIQTIVDAAIKRATKPIEDRLAIEAQARQDAQRRVDEATFRDLVTNEARKAGVASSAMKHVIRDAETTFMLKDGTLVPKEGVKHPTEPHKDLTTNDWLTHLAKEESFLFESSNGGGARPPNGPGAKPGVKKLINPTAVEMGQHTDAIAKGEVVVIRT